MTNVDSDFTGSIPEIYESHLVPILFEGYASDLAHRVAQSDPTAVLEVAAGTGAVTRALAPLLGTGTRYVVSDLNTAMLERARKHHIDDRLEWREANALSLPFEDSSFDVVLCQFGVMFFPDRVKGFSEILRVLRPGGRLLFNSWGTLEKNDFSRIAVETVVELYPENPPLFLARTPFGYADPKLVEADLAAAGYDSVNVEEVELESSVEKGDDFAFGQTHGSPLRAEIEERGDPTLDHVRKSIVKALEARFGTGAIRGRMAALVAEAIHSNR